MEKLFKHLRVCSLENEIVRFEYCPNDHFVLQESLFVAHKKQSHNEIDFNCADKVTFNFKGFLFSFEEEDPLNTLKVFKGSKLVYKYHEIKNSGELPLPNKTPEIFPLMDSPRLLIPEDGYVKNNQGFILESDVKDLFLLVCEKDHLKLRKQFLSLTGRNALPRFKNFGLFVSRDCIHNQKMDMDLVQKYEQHNIPVDSLVINNGWEKDGEKYTVNESLFPNIEDLSRFAHKHGIQVLLNDQPSPLNSESTILDNDEIEFRNSGLTKVYSKGLDGFWYDSLYKLRSGHKDISPKSLGNYLYFDYSTQFHLGFTLDPDVYERNLIMNNVLGFDSLDSRSHCYPLQCGKNTKVDEQHLRNEIIKMNRYSNSMLAHYSSDIGGCSEKINKTQYVRWMEFGALSPVFRPHSDQIGKKFREPWSFDKKTLEICKTYINMRYALLDVLYTASFKNRLSGLGVCSPLYLYNPDDKKCYKEETSYMLGDSILISPITGANKPHSLKKQHFVKGLRLTIYPNKNFKGPKSYTRAVKSFEDINKFYNSVKAQNPKIKAFSFRFKGDIKFNHEYMLALKNDVKSRVFLDNKLIFDDFSHHEESFNELAKIRKNKTSKMTVEAVQRRRLKMLDVVFYKMNKANSKTKIYLPEGEWFNIYHRNVYQGKRYIKEKFKIDETPIFVKAGSLLPLYKKISNTSKLSFKTAIYDYYTSKKVDVKDFFYEDDGLSTAYHIGEYRMNEYRTHFENGRYIIELKGNSKLLEDELKVREVFFKAHIRDNETIEKVLVNGQAIKFKRHDHNRKAIPFLDAKFARDSKTLTFKFKHIIKDNYKIELVVREKQ